MWKRLPAYRMPYVHIPHHHMRPYAVPKPMFFSFVMAISILNDGKDIIMEKRRINITGAATKQRNIARSNGIMRVFIIMIIVVIVCAPFSLTPLHFPILSFISCRMLYVIRNNLIHACNSLMPCLLLMYEWTVHVQQCTCTPYDFSGRQAHHTH